jgi:hypothetical protein
MQALSVDWVLGKVLTQQLITRKSVWAEYYKTEVFLFIYLF